MYAKPRRKPARIPESDRTAFAYARVSSKEQAEGYSTAAQKRALADYAHQHGFTVLETFEDVESAKAAGREQFQRMLDRIQRGDCRRILVEKTDRLYRNQYDAAVINQVLGAEVHLVKEREVVSPGASSQTKLMHGIRVVMAANYTDNLSEEVVKGMRQKAREGLWPSCAPMGYANAERDGKHVIVPDPVTGPLVRQMFEWYGTGQYGIRDVARMAREAGLSGRRSRNRVPTSTIHKALSNVVYTGSFEWDGERYEGKHEPIVSPALFARVQELLKRQGNAGTSRKDFIYSGLVKCGHCGCALVGEVKKGKYRYYRCTGWKGRCGEPYVREEALTERFKDALADIAIDEQVAGWIAEALRDSAKQERQTRDEARARHQAEYDRLQARLDAAYEDRLDGRISTAMYDQKAAEWRRRQDELSVLLDAHRGADRSYVDEGVRLLDLMGRVPELFLKADASSRRQILRFVVSNSTWAKGALTLEYREPFNYVADTVRAQRITQANGRRPVVKLSNWRATVDAFRNCVLAPSPATRALFNDLRSLGHSA